MAKSKNVTYFDLDAVVQEEIVIKLGGKNYPLVPVSVENFVANTRLIEKLGDIGDDMDAQLDLTTNLLLQAIPSMTKEIVMGMSMMQMQKLVELAHNMNGQKEAEQKFETAKANAGAVTGDPK